MNITCFTLLEAIGSLIRKVNLRSRQFAKRNRPIQPAAFQRNEQKNPVVEILGQFRVVYGSLAKTVAVEFRASTSPAVSLNARRFERTQQCKDRKGHRFLVRRTVVDLVFGERQYFIPRMKYFISRKSFWDALELGHTSFVYP